SLDVSIFSVNYGAAKQKARRLTPLEIAGIEGVERPVLQAIVGKESGQVYYASKPLSASVSAVRLLEAAPDSQTAYSRLPLLLTPARS
ncbi:unnamed protein product, partial [Symbiodinium pilosum]